LINGVLLFLLCLLFHIVFLYYSYFDLMTVIRGCDLDDLSQSNCLVAIAVYCCSETRKFLKSTCVKDLYLFFFFLSEPEFIGYYLLVFRNWFNFTNIYSVSLTKQTILHRTSSIFRKFGIIIIFYYYFCA